MPVLTFDLVVTDKQWKLRQDGAREKESALQPQWLITCGGETTWISLKTAIAYVRQTRAKTNDPIIRRNASKTLQQLTQMQ